jgi:cobyrinic acid a,c-diamide synthase
LLLLLRRAGVGVRAFKKGPDYIDPSWLSWAAANPARNLDTLLMGMSGVRSSFACNSIADGVSLIEGNRGLFDGFDAAGTHSSAALADALSTPVVLVLDATKMTRTAAAVVLGCQHLDPRISIRGVVLNNVNGKRHKQILRAAIESACSIPVIGALPRVTANPLPERHLGLVPPLEHRGMGRIEQALLEMMDHNLDLDALLTMAHDAPPIEVSSPQQPRLPDAHGLKIGYLKDAAFSFYYPENLEELQRAGAELVPVSAIQQAALPQSLSALYIGGGFPETHAQNLEKNTSFLASLLQAAESGLPIFAECGGLMLLARSLFWRGKRHTMANVFPFDVEVCDAPQGHGYSELQVDSPNPFFLVSTVLHGHEFHYSRIVGIDEPLQTACAVARGTGCISGRDSVVYRNTMASYTHLHALASPEWTKGFLTAACSFALRA